MVKNEKNLEYLQKLQSSLGFGEKLNAVLESAISREFVYYGDSDHPVSGQIDPGVS